MVSHAASSLVTIALLGASLAAQSITGPATQIPSGSGARIPAPSARLLVVDDTPGCRFADNIQAAVNAATEQDVILVRAGNYAGFVVDGKSVRIAGDSSEFSAFIKINGPITVKNVPAGGAVLLRGLKAGVFPPPAVVARDNASPVWLERCDGFAFTVDASAVGFLRSSGYWETTVLTNAAQGFAYTSRFEGRPGGNGFADCGGTCSYDSYYEVCQLVQDGASGLPGMALASASSIQLFGSAVNGGTEGSAFNAGNCCGPCYANGGLGASGLILGVGTDGLAKGSVLHGGGASYPDVSGPGAFTTLSGTVGAYTISRPVENGGNAQLKFFGPAGWNVFLTYALDFEPAYVPEREGVSVVAPEAPTIPVGAIPLSGSLQVSLPVRLPPGADAAVLYTQAKLYDPSTGTPYLAEPSALIVYRRPCP